MGARMPPPDYIITQEIQNGEKKNWLDTYLTPAKELVGYECYVSCDYEDKFAIGKFSVIIIKNGEVVAKEKNHIYCASKAVVIVEAILFMMQNARMPMLSQYTRNILKITSPFSTRREKLTHKQRKNI